MSADDFYKSLSKEDRKAVKNLKEKKKTDFVSSGSWVINALIGNGFREPGGLPRGHVVEVFGNESCGKTTLGISACRMAQSLGAPMWLDFERTFSKDYAKTLGLDLDPSKFIFVEPNHFQHGIKLIDTALDTSKPPLIVVDSVSAMIPREYLEGKVDEMGRIGLHAQLMSVGLQWLIRKLPDSNTCLLFINQLRSVIKKDRWDKGPDEETSGGRAIRYYSSVRLSMRTAKIEKVEKISHITGKKEKEPVNVEVNVTVSKNKIDKPHYRGPIYIRFGEGFDNISSLIELALNTNLIKKNGTSYTCEVGGKNLFKLIGREQVRVFLDENPDIRKLISSNVTFVEDEESKLEAEQEEKETLAGDLDMMLEQTSATYVEKVEEKKEEVKEKKNVKGKN